jgi:hypothetical protein
MVDEVSAFIKTPHHPLSRELPLKGKPDLAMFIIA